MAERPTLKALSDRLNKFAALTVAALRSSVSTRLGKSYYSGTTFKRDLYEALGYTTTPTHNQMQGYYERQDIAKAVIDVPVRACWRDLPEITESDEEETVFEKQWLDLESKRRCFHYFSRVDRMASIDKYAVLLIGFSDARPLEQPCERATDVLYLMPYSEPNAAIAIYDTDSTSERYGLPEYYDLTFAEGTGIGTTSRRVHHSRLIHVTEDNLESDVNGTPRLLPILNRLEDLERVTGGSAEMFWRGAFPGYQFDIPADATIGEQDLDDLQDELEDYMHDLKRYIRTRGVEVKDLAMQVANPREHVDVLIDLISAATRIPRRILLGSERGELASSQDEKNWAARVDERRREHCESGIIRPFIDRLIEVGVFNEPAEGYTVDWPDLLSPSDKDKADVGAIKSKALKDYADAVGAQDIVPPEIFLKRFLDFSDDEIEQVQDILETILKEEEQDAQAEPTSPPELVPPPLPVGQVPEAASKFVVNPMPRPGKGESKKDFISRFMGDDAMVAEFPDAKQRRAVAESQWEKAHGG